MKTQKSCFGSNLKCIITRSTVRTIMLILIQFKMEIHSSGLLVSTWCRSLSISSENGMTIWSAGIVPWWKLGSFRSYYGGLKKQQKFLLQR